MGIAGLWKILHAHRDAKIVPETVYIDGWYLVLRVATAMQTVAEEYRTEVIQRTILSRRKGIISMRPKNIIIVYDGVGVALLKLPRATPRADDAVISSVVVNVRDIFGDIASIIQLQPGIEADDYIISNATPVDAIISDDSDMLVAGTPVIRFNGDVYLPDDVLMDLGRGVGATVSLETFKKAAEIARGDKRTGMGIIAALRDVLARG